MSKLKVEKFGDRHICIGGVGELFHTEGFPLGMSAKQLANNGIELSWFPCGTDEEKPGGKD